MAEKIQYIGIDELADFEKSEFKELCLKYYNDFIRDLRNEVLMIVHIKTHRKTEEKEIKKEIQASRKSIHYSIHVRVKIPSMTFEAKENGYENPVFILKNIFKKIEKEREKRFRE